jgi:3-oxoadipate enol-lactonase
MPTLSLSDGYQLHYQIDDFTDPWSKPETLVLLHGLAEGCEAWRAWVPHLARHYRVIRLDQRGFGASTPAPESFEWSIDVPVEDLAQFAAKLELPAFHLVSAKFGGTVAMPFAARHPGLVKTLSVVSSPVSLQASLGDKIPDWNRIVKSQGVRAWASGTMGGRLGRDMPAVAQEWWADMMGKTAQSTVLGILRTLAQVDVTADLPAIACPTLVVTTTGSGLGSVDAVRAWQQRIPHSELLALDDDSYHIAASKPDRCAQAVLTFIAKHSSAKV